MTNVFGTAAPEVSISPVDTDTGPLQLSHAFVVSTPCVMTHIRYYVSTPAMQTYTPTLSYYAWRQGEPDSLVEGSLTIPGVVGWATAELSPHLFVPANRWFGAAVSFPAGDIIYGAEFRRLPASNKLMLASGSSYDYSAALVSPYSDLGASWALGTSYLIDVEVAMSEMVNLDPADLSDGDVIQVRRTINGTVNTGGVVPITDAYTVNMRINGGPLDGEDVDVWIPDTIHGLAAADMQLLKELPDPPFGSQWQSVDGALWTYQGGGVYDCFSPGAAFDEGAKTTRASTPSLTTWSP